MFEHDAKLHPADIVKNDNISTNRFVSMDIRVSIIVTLSLLK